MKTINIREARDSLADLVEQAQNEPICLTRHGKPVAIIAGVEGVDLGSVILEGRKEIWDMIERARKDKRPRKTLQEIKDKYKIGPAKKAG